MKEKNKVQKNKNHKLGFTLLELLVVVLIIGMLASIALPQYRRVVEKSKATEALNTLKSVSQSIQRYYLVNNSYPTNFNDLDITIPFKGNKKFINDSYHFGISNTDWSLTFENSETYTALYMAIIKGKYQGAYFNINLKVFSDIFCYERKNGAIYIFDTNLAPGSYCEKIMGGTYSGESYYSRFYKLP